MSKFYATKTVGKTKWVFGPFATLRDAELASYLTRSVEERDSATGVYRRAYTACGTEIYDDQRELDYLTQYPQENGYNRVIVRPVATIHASWRKLGLDFARNLFARDRGEVA